MPRALLTRLAGSGRNALHWLAGQLGIPHAARDVFLDNDPSAAAILRRLAEAETFS